MKEKGIVNWIALGVVLLAILNLPDATSLQIKAALRDGVAPLQSLMAGFGRGFRQVGQSLRGLGGLATENRSMAAELIQLRNEVRQLKALERENIALRDALKFARSARRAMIPCEVIGRDLTGWWQTLRLGKGSEAGILPHMAVLTPDGLIGKTVTVSSRTAEVLLLTDPQCRISAQIARNGAHGIVTGLGSASRGQSACRMTFINKNLPIQPGDEVVTSGLGGIFPKGLLIGYADRIVLDDSGLYQSAEVVPRADFGMLEYVFVLAEPGDRVEGQRTGGAP